MNQIEKIEENRLNGYKLLKENNYELYEVYNDLLNVMEALCKSFKSDEDKIRITMLIFNKGKLLSKAIYNSIVVGFGQEAGSMFRVLVEISEVITYIRLFQEAIQEIIDDKLPSAGKIAMKIDGNMKPIRDHLNNHSSHFKFSYESFAHTVSIQEEELLDNPPLSDESIKVNMKLLCSITYLLINESIATLDDRIEFEHDVLIKLDAIRRKLLSA